MFMHLELSALHREESHNEPMHMFYIYIKISLSFSMVLKMLLGSKQAIDMLLSHKE